MALKIENNLGNILTVDHSNGSSNLHLSSKELASTKLINNIAELRLISGVDANKLEVLGYYEKGDGGGGLFYWDSTSIEPDNRSTIIQANGIATGK